MAEVSVVFGTMTIPKQTDQATGTTMIKNLLSAGFNHLDTARMYADGKCEETLGP